LYWADISKIRGELGWEAKIGFAEGVGIMRQNIEHWRDAPVLDGGADRRRDGGWFRFLGGDTTGVKQGGAVQWTQTSFPDAGSLGGARVAARQGHKRRGTDADIEWATPVRENRRPGARHFRSPSYRPCRHLEAARALGDVLVVTFDGRPVREQGSGRRFSARRCGPKCLQICNVSIGSRSMPTPMRSVPINLLRPDIYVKGKDYQNPEGDVTGKS